MPDGFHYLERGDMSIAILVKDGAISYAEAIEGWYRYQWSHVRGSSQWRVGTGSGMLW